MQVQYDDGTYSQPEEIGLDTLVEEIGLRSGVRRVLLFASYDKEGKRTKELRQAWKRYRRSLAKEIKNDQVEVSH